MITCRVLNAGSWFELATNPSSLRTFEKGCYCTQATYTLQPTGLVQVNNTCRIGAVNGTVYTVVGTGRIPTPGYLVVFVDPEYRVAVVWSCEEFVPFMWILSRTPTVPDAVYSFLLVKAQELTGYDVSKLVRTVQQGCMY